MRRRRVQLAAVVAVTGLLGVAAAAVAGGGANRDVREHLTGYGEVPALSTTGFGDFKAKVRNDRIEYRLTFGGLEGDVTQSHIHFGNEWDVGGISAFLCNRTNPGAPAGTPACTDDPADLRSGTVEGTIEPEDVIGPAGQGIKPGEYGELLRAIRAGVTYANVHSTLYPAGEIRAQLENGRGHHGH